MRRDGPNSRGRPARIRPFFEADERLGDDQVVLVAGAIARVRNDSGLVELFQDRSKRFELCRATVRVSHGVIPVRNVGDRLWTLDSEPRVQACPVEDSFDVRRQRHDTRTQDSALAPAEVVALGPVDGRAAAVVREGLVQRGRWSAVRFA